MKIDKGSLAFNIKVAGKSGGTPTWGTSVVIQDAYNHILPEAKNLIIGMVHNKVWQYTDDFQIPLGKGGHVYNGKDDYALIPKTEPFMVSVFQNTYVNNKRINKPFVLVLVRDKTDDHNGRLQIKYSPKIQYKDIRNQDFFKEVERVFGLEANTPWMVCDIDVVDQDKLVFRAGFRTENVNDEFSDSKEYTEYYQTLLKKGVKAMVEKKPVDEKYRPYINAMMAKPFVLLAGISGTGKSQIVRKLARATDDIDFEPNENSKRWAIHNPANFKLIQVKPNWHNSLELIGFKSNINGAHYETTEFMKFVVDSWLHVSTPFFLCLDEMNLAPVEEYFAEFLSAIESRSFEDGVYKTDSLIQPFKNFGSDFCEKMIADLMEGLDADDVQKDVVAEKLRNEGLVLPPNLIVFGTVNMDETTFSFSRKVLDRAMSIEMNEVDFNTFLPEENPDAHSSNPPILIGWNPQIVKRLTSGYDVQTNNVPQGYKPLTDEEIGIVVGYFNNVNCLLDDTPFKLGYRACSEALLYVRAGKELCDQDEDIMKLLDEFTLMKILSRIEGDDSKLRFDFDSWSKHHSIKVEVEPENSEANESEEDRDIDNFNEGFEGVTDDATTGDNTIYKNLDFSDEKYSNLLVCLKRLFEEYFDNERSQSIKKIQQMINTLENEHFVSYWN